MTKRQTVNKAKSQKSSGWVSWVWLFKLATVLLVLGVVILIYLDAQIRHRFEGHRWSLPAKVYSRPLELFNGQQFAEGQLDYELTQLGYRWVKRAKAPGQVQKIAQGMVIYSRGFRFTDGNEQGHLVEVTLNNNEVTQLRQTSGAAIALLRLEPQLVGGIYPTHNEDRELIQLNDLPNGFIETLLAVEDRHYYSHYGISPWGIARAMWANIKAGAVVQGGSTLTQQLVKNFYLTDRQTLWRKLIEAPMALLLNVHYSKEEVCNMIKKKLDGYVYFAEIGEDKDKRNYIVSYDKIRKTGFRLKYDLDYGINELIQTMPLINNQSKFFNA